MQNNQLIITDLVLGSGKEIERGALCSVHYTGRLKNDTIFDSSIQKDRLFQFVFGTGRVIKGWDQGLVGMKVGGKRELFVPAHLAYGDRKIGDLIPANSDLFFEIELFEVLTRD